MTDQSNSSSEKNFFNPVSRRWLSILFSIFLLTIFCAAPSPAGLSQEGQRLAGVIVVMAFLWSSQAIPLELTSLLPLIAFPFLGIASAGTVSKAYMNSTIFLYFSGFAIAIGVEKWGLHRRLALKTLRVVGAGPKRIVLAFMFGTAVLSMWISNTASTLLMLPIALAVLDSLHVDAESEAEREDLSRRFCLALLLGIAYSASIGGMCTLIGTPTNGVYAGYWSATGAPPEVVREYSVSVGQWMLMFFPIGGIMLLILWGLSCVSIGKRLSFGSEALNHIHENYRALGPIRGGEFRMMLVFAAVAILWTTRASLEIGWFHFTGWEQGLTYLLTSMGVELEYRGLLHDSTAGLLMMFIMFLIPAGNKSGSDNEFLMDWKTIEQKTPWGILLLFGGGFAIADACGATGFASWLGERLADIMTQLGSIGQMLSVTTLVIFLTEFTSNTATIATLLPILEKTAVALQMDPRSLMLPATIAASCAFMLPIATPPNAIVFSSNRIKVWEMMKHGFVLNIISVLVITLLTLTWVLQIGLATHSS